MCNKQVDIINKIMIMKKIILTMALAVACTAGFAQKGQNRLGLNLSYGTEVAEFGIGAKYQRLLDKNWRVELGTNYFFTESKTSLWDLNANAQYLFPLNGKLKAYPLAGLTLVSSSAGDYSETRLGVNIGGGLEYDINSTWAVNGEVRGQLVRHFNQAVFSVGVMYKF